MAIFKIETALPIAHHYHPDHLFIANSSFASLVETKILWLEWAYEMLTPRVCMKKGKKLTFSRAAIWHRFCSQVTNARLPPRSTNGNSQPWSYIQTCWYWLERPLQFLSFPHHLCLWCQASALSILNQQKGITCWLDSLLLHCQMPYLRRTWFWPCFLATNNVPLIWHAMPCNFRSTYRSLACPHCQILAKYLSSDQCQTSCAAHGYVYLVCKSVNVILRSRSQLLCQVLLDPRWWIIALAKYIKTLNEDTKIGFYLAGNSMQELMKRIQNNQWGCSVTSYLMAFHSARYVLHCNLLRLNKMMLVTCSTTTSMDMAVIYINLDIVIDIMSYFYHRTDCSWRLR